MPQFEIANFIPQMFWLAIFFAILYFLVVRPTLPKLGRVMTERETRIGGDLDTAQHAKAEADRMAAEHEAGVADAHARARARVAEAQAAAAKSLEARLAASNAAIDARTAETQASIEAARASATGQIETVAADAAADIVQKLTGVRPDPGASATAARAALA